MIILGTNSIKDTGFDVDNSCMFNTASNQELTKSISSTSNRRTGTLSAWVKLCDISGTAQAIFSNLSGGTNRFLISFESGSILKIGNRASGTYDLDYRTNRVFKDPSAWLHVVVRIDTTQSSSGDRVKLWINGVEETSFSSSVTPSQNSDTQLNLSGHDSKVGGGNKLNGYLAEVFWLDGQTLAPTDFGEYDEDSGIWKPKNVSGLTFGTNGFYVDFEDSSALGTDKSGNGNNFTASNLSATNQAIDTPTNNFAVNNKLSNIASRWTFTNGNNTIQHANGGAWTAMISSIAPAVGKYYMETKITGGASRTMFGVMSADTNIMGYETNLNTICLYYNLSGGEFQQSGGVTSGNNYGTFADNDTAGIALDCTNNKIAIYKNGSALVTNHTIPATVTGFIGFGFTSDSNSTVYQCNYGSPYYAISSGNADANGYGNFEYAVPSGYYALCTKNLAEYG